MKQFRTELKNAIYYLLVHLSPAKGMHPGFTSGMPQRSGTAIGMGGTEEIGETLI